MNDAHAYMLVGVLRRIAIELRSPGNPTIDNVMDSLADEIETGLELRGQKGTKALTYNELSSGKFIGEFKKC